MAETLSIAAVTLIWAGLVGALGVLFTRSARRARLTVLVPAIAALSVAVVLAGVIGSAQAMFLSAHDLRVVLVVCAVAGIFAVGLAVGLGRMVLAGTAALGMAARQLGDGAAVSLKEPPPTAELARLGAELSRASQRLGQAREREQAIEASRRALVAGVSHDLRTPLAALRAMAEALDDGMVDDAARYHRRMRDEVDRLTGLVDDLFELSRIQAGTLSLVLDDLDLDELVSDTLASSEPVARAGGVRLSGRPAATPVRVQGDVRKLSRALGNLVANAVRHTSTDGVVTIAAERRDGEAVISVTDSCGGLTPERLSTLEAALNRPPVLAGAQVGSAPAAGELGVPVGAPIPRPDGGGGLGLAIVRGIVEAHDGEVRVTNVAGGCRFEFCLPSRDGH